MLSEGLRNRLINLLDSELKEVEADIGNNTIWRIGSSNLEEEAMFENNILDLLDYKDVLLGLRERAVEGELCGIR